MAREPVTGMGSLHLPKDVGVSRSTEDVIQSRWDTIGEISEELEQAGMLPNTEPTVQWRPVTAEVLVSTDVKDFTTLFSQQLLWYNYANRLLADVRAHKLQVDNQMVDIEAEKKVAWRTYNRTAAKVDKMGVGEIDATIQNDPVYRELRLQQQRLEQKRIRLDAWVDELLNSLKTVSRQIENRRGEVQQGNRDNRMSGSASGRWDPKTSGSGSL